MSFFPELDALSLAELQARFLAPPPEDANLGGDPQLWYEELAVAIRERDPHESACFLRGQVDREDPDRLTAILLAITWFDERDRVHADLLIEALDHADEHVVARAIRGLAGLGGCGLTERVLARGADPRVLVRGAVLRFARLVVPDRAPALLLDALHDPHYIVRSTALDELDELDYTPALPRIEALSKDLHPHVRGTALTAIANLGPPGAAIPLLLDALHDPHYIVRESAVRELDELEYTPALADIEALSSDPHSDVRQAALAAVAKLGPPDAAISLLLGALHDPDATIRFTAVNHLGKFEQFTDRAALEPMLDDPEQDVREHTRHILDHHFA